MVHVAAERFAFTPSEIVVEPGEEIELRLNSDDTAHGFRIAGTNVNIVIPKRGRQEVVTTLRVDHAGPLRIRVHADVRCRPQLHARRADRARQREENDDAHTLESAAAIGVFGSTLALSALLPAAQQAVLPGDPLPGMTASEFSEFRLGLEDFTEVETAEDGLGPGVQRHQLRRLPQRSGDRRRQRRLETRAAYRTEQGASPGSTTTATP